MVETKFKVPEELTSVSNNFIEQAIKLANDLPSINLEVGEVDEETWLQLQQRLNEARSVRLTFAQRGGHTAGAIREAEIDLSPNSLHIVFTPEASEITLDGNLVVIPSGYLAEEGWDSPSITNQWSTDPKSPGAIEGAKRLAKLNPLLIKILEFLKDHPDKEVVIVNDVKAEFTTLLALLAKLGKLPTQLSLEQHLVTPGAKARLDFQELQQDRDFVETIFRLALQVGLFTTPEDDGIKEEEEAFQLPGHVKFVEEKITAFLMFLAAIGEVKTEVVIDDIPHLLAKPPELPPQLASERLEELKHQAKEHLLSWLEEQEETLDPHTRQVAEKIIKRGEPFRFVRLSSNPAGAFNRLAQIESDDTPTLVVGNLTPTEQNLIARDKNRHHLGFVDPITLWCCDILAFTQATEFNASGGPVNTPTEVIKRFLLLRDKFKNQHEVQINFLHPATVEDIKESLAWLTSNLKSLPENLQIAAVIGLLIVIETFEERWQNLEDLQREIEQLELENVTIKLPNEKEEK